MTLTNLSVTFPGLAAPALVIDSLKIAAGERLAVTGASGSGKSTFVNIVTGLERPATGSVDWSGCDIARLSESRRDAWRGANVGLIMQDFHLFPGLSVLDNVLLPARLARQVTPDRLIRAHHLIARVGLSRPDQRIETMSRGEMQRVAVARALLRNPGVIVADEPTASLDAENAQAVGLLLSELAEAEGSTLIVISHDTSLTARFDRRIVLKAGRIAGERDAGEIAA